MITANRDECTEAASDHYLIPVCHVFRWITLAEKSLQNILENSEKNKLDFSYLLGRVFPDIFRQTPAEGSKLSNPDWFFSPTVTNFYIVRLSLWERKFLRSEHLWKYSQTGSDDCRVSNLQFFAFPTPHGKGLSSRRPKIREWKPRFLDSKIYVKSRYLWEMNVGKFLRTKAKVL